jgi:hypothetical protein
MSRHDASVALRQMYDHIAEAIALAETRTRADFDSDRVFLIAREQEREFKGQPSTIAIVPSLHQHGLLHFAIPPKGNHSRMLEPWLPFAVFHRVILFLKHSRDWAWRLRSGTRRARAIPRS